MTAIESEARSWVGTPFVQNSAIKGPHGGVCCHLGVAEIAMECGIVHRRPVPPGSPRRYNQTKSLMEQFIDLNFCPPLSRLTLPFGIYDLQVGDVLGFKIGNCVNHLALVVGSDLMFQATLKEGAQVTRLVDSSWASRLTVAWRNPLWDHRSQIRTTFP